MYSQMNCLIENEYIRELSKKNEIIYVFPNELPNWKRIHKGTFPPQKKTRMYSQMNCLIENDYIKGTFQKKTPMYSQMNCLIENDYIKGTVQKNKKPPMHSQMNCLIENEYIQWPFLEL